MHAKPGAVGQAILVQELGSSKGGQGGPPQPGQGSQSAQAARHVLQAVHTFVALTQIQQVTVVALSFSGFANEDWLDGALIPLLVLLANENVLDGICAHSFVLFANGMLLRLSGRYTHHLTPLDQP